MKSIAILATTLAIASISVVSADSTSANLMKYVAQLSTDTTLQLQFIQGLQADPTDTTHQCTQSYNLFSETLSSLSGLLTEASTKIKANPQNLMDYGKYFKQAKGYISQYILFFNVYTNCNLEHIIISLGKMVQTISGASNGVVNLAFRYFQDDYTDFNAACDAYSPSQTSVIMNPGANQYTVYCGTELAKIFKKFLTYQVPQYQINEYNQPKTSNT
eukprot:403333197